MILTDKQRAVLAYFRSLADKQPRTAPNLDPRVLAGLRRRGLLEHVAGYYGGQHRITDAGRKALPE